MNVPTLRMLGDMITRHHYNSYRPLDNDKLRWVMHPKTEYNIAQAFMGHGCRHFVSSANNNQLLDIAVIYDTKMPENEVQLYVNTQT